MQYGACQLDLISHEAKYHVNNFCVYVSIRFHENLMFKVKALIIVIFCKTENINYLNEQNNIFALSCF